MTGLDTNVLVRYLTWDDPDQAARAAALIEESAEAGAPLFVSTVVLCEVVWVLETAYGTARSEVLDTLDALLRTAQFTFSEKDVLWAALGDARRGEADFPDCVIGRQGDAAGCERTVTFDRTAAAGPHFELL